VPVRSKAENAPNETIYYAASLLVFAGSIFAKDVKVCRASMEGKAKMNNPATDSIATNGDSRRVVHLFRAILQYKSQAEQEAVVPSEGREGAYIGSGDGAVEGGRLSGMVRWSLWAGDCVYPLLRSGQNIPDGLHLCTMNPVGFIETTDGARVRFDGRGYGLRTPERYQTSLTLVFGTEDARYSWLTRVLGVMEGEFDEKAGRAT
jgi:hypothetical protein